MLLALAVTASALLSGGGDVDCTIFSDGIKTYEEVIEECQEFADGYDWEPPVYEEPVTECWRQWQFGFVSSCESGGTTYTVQDGDLSLWSISQSLGISFGALLDANPTDPDLIHVGDVIYLP